MSATDPSSRHHGSEPELRRVSVLFADIQGSTAMIQHLEPEAAALLIDPALRVMIDAAERFGGAVSHRGDGIMAIFGAPSVSEDHALRACLAALAIRDALAGGGNTDAALRVRVGLHFGDVVFRPVRTGRSWSHDAVGIAVHIAARLEQSAEPATICLSGAVWRLVSGFVNVAPLDAITVKGVDIPIERFRLLDADRTANRWGVRAANGLAALVGRTREMALLDRALADAASGGSLRLVQIVAAAGLGKSRLLHEFLGRQPVQDCQVISLIGDRHRLTTPFHPVANWLRGWLDIGRTDAMPEAREKLARRIATLAAPDPLDRDLLERILGLGAPGPAIASLGQIATIDFGATVAALFALIAGGRRLAITCEDLDCFDTASRNLLDSTLQRLAGHDALVVTTSRARVRLQVVPQAATRGVTLAPLSDTEATQLLASIDPQLADNPTLAANILRKAGGNPLFLEEVAPLVARHGSTAAHALDDTDFEIPDRVEALIADRLGRLPRQARRLVQLCAVIGTDVPLRLAADLAGVTAEELHPRLLKLQSEQLLYESRKYPDPQFTFKHALTRDVAYRTILAARRRAHHARIVDILSADSRAASDRNPDDLCLHAVQAQLWPQAVHYLQLAARQAVERAANQMAKSYLLRARDIATTLVDGDGVPAQRLDILMSLRVLALWGGDYTEVGAILDEAEPLALESQDTICRSRILATRVHLLNVLGRYDDAIALGERTSEAARRSGDGNLMVTSTFFAGQSYFNAGRLREAERTLSENLQAIAALNDRGAGHAAAAGPTQGSVRTVAPQTYGTRALARASLGEFAAAEADVADASRLAEENGHPYDRVFVSVVAGFTALQRRRREPAEAAFRQALALAETAQVEQLKPPALVGLGHALLLGPDLDEASETLTAAHRISREFKRTNFHVGAATGLALAGLRLGEPDLARRFADEAVELAERLGIRGFGVQALRARGLALAATAGLEDEGLAVLQTALRQADELGMRAEIAHGHAALAASGAAAAERHLEHAAQCYDALGMQPWFDRLRSTIAAGGVPYL